MAFLEPDKIFNILGVKVKEYLLTLHNKLGISMPSKRTKPLKGVTIHNTNVIAVRGTTMAEQYTRATVNGNMKTTRVHYYVDHEEAWQNLPNTWQGWHAADGNGDGNSSTIAIECIMGSENSYNDKKAEDNAAKLAAYLLYTNNLTIDNLYTHTYWLHKKDGREGSPDVLNVEPHSYKNCPLYIIPHWEQFKEKVEGYIDELKDAAAKEDMLYRVQVGAFSVKNNARGYCDSAIKAGFKGSYITATLQDNGHILYRVQVGAFKSKDNAETYKELAKSLGFEAIVVGEPK